MTQPMPTPQPAPVPRPTGAPQYTGVPTPRPMAAPAQQAYAPVQPAPQAPRQAPPAQMQYVPGPQAAPPQGYAPPMQAQQAYAPQMNPQHHAPQGHAPQHHAPQGHAPQHHAPQHHAPQGQPQHQPAPAHYAPQPQAGYAPAPMGHAPAGYGASAAHTGYVIEDTKIDGGEKALPQISIHAFCDRSETASTINETTRDWRMKRTTVKIYMGGLLAAIEYYRKENTPNLIMVETGLRGDELFNQLEQLASVCDEGTNVVIVGASNDIKLYRQLIEKGVSDYLVPPFHPLSLIRSLGALYTDPAKPFVGRTTAFFGAKGGVGSSTLAHNVAWCLSELMGQDTSLVDLDSSWGTTGLDFAYDASQGLEEALVEPERLDETLLDRIMIRHTPKLSILPTAGSLLTAMPTDPDAYEAVVNAVRSMSPNTILDMPHHWSDWTTKVLTTADDVVITAAPDLANLRNTKNLIDFFRENRPNDQPPILILNKVGLTKSNEISVKDFAAAVGQEPALVIGFDPDSFIEAANDGKMLTDIKAASEAVKGLTYIADRLKTGKFNALSSQKSASKGRSFLKKGSGDGGSGVQALFSKLLSKG